MHRFAIACVAHHHLLGTCQTLRRSLPLLAHSASRVTLICLTNIRSSPYAANVAQLLQAAQHITRGKFAIVRPKYLGNREIRSYVRRSAVRNCRSAASYIPRVSRTAPSIWRELWEVDWAFFRPPAATAATIGEPYQMRACLSLRQNNRAWQTLVVHARRDLAGAARDVRRVVAPADPALPNFGVSTLIESVESGFSTNRTAAALGGFFGVVALLVASIGLYAVVVDGVAERTREIGVRVALGATPGSVLQMLMRSGVRLGIIGLAIGLAGAFAVARLMSGLLVGLSPSDPVTFLAVPIVLTAVVAWATWLPARRAVGMDPVAGLRGE